MPEPAQRDHPPPAAEAQDLLFSPGASPAPNAPQPTKPRYQPLAMRLRPRRLEELVGQEHLSGEQALLPRLLAEGHCGSLILYGPPGCGKTSLAEVIAATLDLPFRRLNAVLSNVAELRDLLRWARYHEGVAPLLFIDEIHRFNKAQQDLLLPDLEAGHLQLIGATTHNPGFSVVAPLLSRSQVFQLHALTPDAIAAVLARALEDAERGLGHRAHTAEAPVLKQLARMADGDLRRALNSLETLALSQPVGTPLTPEALSAFARERQLRYDRDADEHYDTISAWIKSMRGGDPDATLYWLAKMLDGGEDPRFLARRLIILASEDVGLADPRALPLAVAAAEACAYVGLPECGLTLAHTATYLALCPKSNTTTLGLSKARQHIREQGLQPVPLWLRDSHTAFNRSLGQGEDYRYSHSYPEAISGQDYMGEPQTFFTPGSAGHERVLAERLEHWRALKRQRQAEAAGSEPQPGAR